MNLPPDPIPAIAKATAKIVLYLCSAILGGIWLTTCNVTPEAIEECRHACNKASNTYMKSVTAKECVCADYASSPEPWVLTK